MVLQGIDLECAAFVSWHVDILQSLMDGKDKFVNMTGVGSLYILLSLVWSSSRPMSSYSTSFASKGY